MNIVVFTPALIHGDAVGHDTLSMVAALRRRGYEAHAAANWIRDDIQAISIDQMAERLASPDDVLIYHHSIGMEPAVRIYEESPCRKIIKYHNVTPARFFEETNKEVVRGCIQGRQQTARLLPTASAVWVDSDFNGRDLQVDHPNQRCEVLPPFNQTAHLMNIDPDPTAVALYDDWLTNILVVGRIVPNKNNLLAVEAFAEYRAKYDDRCRLIFVGDVAQSQYCDQVIERIAQLKLSRHVCITGKISDRQLKALYLTTQMLLTTSSHEGFCLPLVEAMALRVPIVALPNTAIPETAGDAAWYADDQSASIADTMNRVRSSPLEREGKLLRGLNRFAGHFRNEMIERRLIELFEQATEVNQLSDSNLIAA